jgi:hypothetical protein
MEVTPCMAPGTRRASTIPAGGVPTRSFYDVTFDVDVATAYRLAGTLDGQR